MMSCNAPVTASWLWRTPESEGPLVDRPAAEVEIENVRIVIGVDDEFFWNGQQQVIPRVGGEPVQTYVRDQRWLDQVEPVLDSLGDWLAHDHQPVVRVVLDELAVDVGTAPRYDRSCASGDDRVRR